MKELHINLSDNEYRALKDLVYNAFSVCNSSCIWDECDQKTRHLEGCGFTNRTYNYCDVCVYTKVVAGLKAKIEEIG